MKKISNTLIIPPGSCERFLSFSNDGMPEAYSGGRICGGISSPLQPGYRVIYRKHAAHEWIYVTGGSVVTSGDYQRTYVVDGKPYHHIIDPETLYPGEYWRSVTIVCADSGTADALSTALFLLSQSEGQILLDRYDAEAMWVGAGGEILYSDGFEKLIRT